MQSLGTIREFHTKQFSVIVDAIDDDSQIDDLTSDDESREELIRNLNDGTWILFCARVRVFYQSSEVGSDYLGGCVYESLEDFADHMACGKQNREYAARGELGRCGSYFRDMIGEACKDARTTIRRMQPTYIRPNA